MEGGPNWVNNIVDSPIIVDAENGLFYKQVRYEVFLALLRPNVRGKSLTKQGLLQQL